jgi:hypothetical protein
MMSLPLFTYRKTWHNAYGHAGVRSRLPTKGLRKICQCSDGTPIAISGLSGPFPNVGIVTRQ